MSRTRHHKDQKRQHLGHDLWSRRPCAGRSYNAYNKRLTRRRERADKQREISQERRESE